MSEPLVTLTRSAWRDIKTQAAGQDREGGGLLMGKRTRYGNFKVQHIVGLTHVVSNDGIVLYDEDEVAHARIAAYEMYKPLEPVGQWHSHPWPERSILALTNQITDDWDDPQSDVTAMLDGEVELVASIYPHTGHMLKSNEFNIRTRVAGRVICAEVWLRIRHGKIVPCRLTVRG